MDKTAKTYLDGQKAGQMFFLIVVQLTGWKLQGEGRKSHGFGGHVLKEIELQS